MAKSSSDNVFTISFLLLFLCIVNSSPTEVKSTSKSLENEGALKDNARFGRQATGLITEYKSVSDANANVSTSVPTNNHLLQLTPMQNKSIDVKQEQEPPGMIDFLSDLSGVNISTSTVSSSGLEDQYLFGVNESINVPLKTSKEASSKESLSDNKSLLSEEFIDSVDVAENNTKIDLSKHNRTNFKEDLFYNRSISVDEALTKQYWESFKNVSANNMLSRSHRRAMTVQLSFDFSFCGHLVRNVTVATGGFLYTGNFIHSWLAATQYIAPLMANFDTSLSNNSFVKFADNGTAFSVIWENVYLQDKQDVGPFTFSATLYKSGNIVFTYFSVPLFIESIHDDKYTVKVGLSDAYIIDKVIFFAKRKTIHEYYRVNIGTQDIRNSTIIFLTAQPTCLMYTDCLSCLTHNTKLKCSWCPTLNKCSTGIDWYHQDWVNKGCDRVQIEDNEYCPTEGQNINRHGAESQDNIDNSTYEESINVPLKSSKEASSKESLSDNKSLLSEKFIDSVDVAENNTKIDLSKHNRTNFKEDLFYNRSISVDEALTKQYWESFKNVSANNMLSRSHRRAMTVQLSFDFSFCGHLVRNVTVATGGFLYTGNFVHSWLAATQYIAPLMANFDTSLSNNSFVKFADNGTAFSVIWENVYLQDKQDVGPFTFSATLYKSGNIVFTYFSVPLFIESIHDDKYTVKVGLSDAYIIDKVIFFAKRKTIHEYYRVNIGTHDIRNSTIIFLTAQPTCLMYTDCPSCLTHNTKLKCSWCPTLNKCSTGIDWYRQDWVNKGCDRVQIEDNEYCPTEGQNINRHDAESQDDIDNSTYEGERHTKNIFPTYVESSTDKPIKTTQNDSVK